MSPRLRKVLLWIIYPVFYLVCFITFAFVTFPFNTLRDRIVVAFAEDQRKSSGDSRLEIDSLSSYWLSGVEAHGVRLISAPSTKADGTKSPQSEIELDRATARVAILPLLFGNVAVSFSAELFGGKINGSTRTSGEDRSVSLEISNLSVGDITPLADLVGLPISGALGGTVNFNLPEGKIAKATGSIALTIQDLAVGDGKAKIKDMIALPRLVVGDLELTCDVAEGRVSITKFEAAGNDLDFVAEGKITLREKPADSFADVSLRFKFSDKYKAKDANTQALFGTPGSNAPALIEMDPHVKQSKRPDGFYGWRASGLVRAMRFDPAPSGGQGSGRGSGSGVRGGNR